jgi:hypothetical protein
VSAELRSVARAEDTHARQRFVSDVFHAISQPLTSLRCCIELALMQEGTLEAYRDALTEALTHAERVNRCAEFVRLMAEAEDPGNPCETELSDCVSAAVAEFAPVFEANDRSVTARCGSGLRVFADAEKLERALFLVLDSCAAEGCNLVLAVEAGQLEICCRDRYALPGENANPRAQQSLDLAKQMLAAMGARLEVVTESRLERLTVTWPKRRL